MHKLIFKSTLVLIAALTAPVAFAQDIAPDVLVKSVTQEGNPAKVAELVESRVLPRFDCPRMTRIAVARNWQQATPEQQAALTAEFKTLLVRTYSVALATYRDQVIEYKPLRAAPEATEVTVRSEVQQSGRERMTLDYAMEKTPAGWKVYDIKIAGVSMVTTYRDTFAARVRDGGIEGLIKSLWDRNQQGRLNTAQTGQPLTH